MRFNRSEIINSRIIKPEDFLWRRYTPSSFVKGKIVRVFSLIYSNFENDFNVKNLNFEEDKFRMLIEYKETTEIFDFYISDNGWDKKCNWVFCTNKVCNWVHYNIWNQWILKFLLSFAKKWVDLDLDFFLKILSFDPKAKKDYYKIFWQSKRPPFSIIQDWAHPTHKVRFIVPEGVLRNLSQSLEFTINQWQIHHAERECQAIWPEIDFEKELRFFAFPKEFYNHTFDKYFYLSEEDKNNIHFENNWGNLDFFTDLSEDDIVMWKGNEKLEEGLNYLIENIEKNKIKTLSFNCCCVPRIVWDDIQSALMRAKEKIKIPFLFSWQLEKTPFEQKISMLEDYLSQINVSKYKKESSSITLFWYHENPYLKYLNDIFQKNNIVIKAIFIPSINVNLLHKLFETELLIFSPNNFQAEVFEYPFKNMGVPYISPQYPYWLLNTNNWFEEIFKKLWKKYIPWKEELDLINEYKIKVKYVSNNKYKIGLIFIWKQQLDIFFNSDYTNNVDVIKFLEEMGFIIEFFVYDNFDNYLVINNETKFTKDDSNHEKIIKQINDKVTSDKHWINFFSKEEELYKLLNEKSVDLVYSDLWYENRLVKLWINTFNVKSFDAWYIWALDSINNLIKLIELDYFKKIWKYIYN